MFLKYPKRILDISRNLLDDPSIVEVLEQMPVFIIIIFPLYFLFTISKIELKSVKFNGKQSSGRNSPLQENSCCKTEATTLFG